MFWILVMKKILRIAALAALAAGPAAAEIELSFYMGLQGVQDSKGSGTAPNGTPISRDFDWRGKSLENPYYYGARVTWWTANDIGFGIEGTHTKAYASTADKAAIGFDRLELSDGHNIFTANVMKRWPGYLESTAFTPYAGAGIGFAMPHVDAKVTGSANRTFGYEVTGLALRGIAGMKYAITENWALFGEYQITWSDNDITLKDGAQRGKLSTDIVTHALNIGVSYSF